MDSAAIVAKALYSASVDDCAMARYFFELHEMGVRQRKKI
jgi:hypothetical protein